MISASPDSTVVDIRVIPRARTSAIAGTLRNVAVIAALCVCVGSEARAQANPPAISGRVLAAEAATPLRRARISVATATGPWRAQPVLTDNDGRFTVTLPAAGTVPFTVTITKGGYLTVAAKVERKDVESTLIVRLIRGAAVSGAVVDKSGMPVPAIAVTATRVEGPVAGLPAQYSTTSDDLGEYRLAGLASGRYDVWAGTAMTVTLSLPGAPGARVEPIVRQVGAGEKTAVTLQPAEEIGGIQLVAPDEGAADAALRELRESGRLPPNSVTSVLAGQTGVILERAATRQPPRGLSAAIKGRVLSAARTPVRGATVRVEGMGVDQAVRTDVTGAFSLVGLPPGQYTIRANAEGHTNWFYGQAEPGQAGRPMNITRDQVVDGINILMPPARAITGVIVDEHGEPLEGARVQALELRYRGGRTVAIPVGTARSTDDRGRYRVWGMYPGSYVLAASMEGLVSSGNRQSAYAKTYFPGTATIGAALPIDLREDAIANFMFTSTGLTDVHVTARDGDAPLVAGTGRMVETRRSVSASEPRVADIERDGRIVFRNVPPGEYVVQVRGDGPGRTGLFGTQELLVGAEPAHVTLAASYGANVEGRITFEGEVEYLCGLSSQAAGTTVNASCGRTSPPFQIVTVALDDRARDPTSGVIAAGGEFFATGLFGLTSFALQRAPADDWYLKAWTINGVDVADTGYDFGAQPREISGSEIVLSKNGAVITGRAGDVVKASSDYFAVVFPAAREMRLPQARRVKFTRSTVDGTFRVAGLPPGDYFVAAVTRLVGTRDDGEWQNPEVLMQLEPLAERIPVSEGQSVSVSLRLIDR